MSGFEKILAKIESDAESNAALILAEAEIAASRIIEERMLVSQKREAERLETANVSANAILSRGKAAAEAERKRMLLAERNRLLNLVLSSALENLQSLPAETAFETIRSFVVACPLTENAEITLSQNDLTRIPKNFEEDLSASVGVNVAIRKTPGDFSFGCIVSSGEIEYNGTAEGILYDRRDELRDIANRILFANSTTGVT